MTKLAGLDDYDRCALGDKSTCIESRLAAGDSYQWMYGERVQPVGRAMSGDTMGLNQPQTLLPIAYRSTMGI